MKWLADQVLAWLQKRCDHPGVMVAADILEGDGRLTGIQVKWCRRCGSVAVRSAPSALSGWRFPDPNLWRGK